MSEILAGGGPVPGLRLPFRFDLPKLQAALAGIPDTAWVPHYNERDFGGIWNGVALRSRSGLPGDLMAHSEGPSDFQDTPLLGGHPAFREVLAHFPCRLKAVRLLALAPNSYIREHSDNGLGFEEGEVRIHVPIHTNPAVEFYVCGERMDLREGLCYYLNVNLPHRVSNRGDSARIHLVIDAEVDTWVRELFAASHLIERSPLPPHGVDEFRSLVFNDTEILARLSGISRRHEFPAAAVAVAREHGFNLHEADIEASFRARSQYSGGLAGWLPTRLTATRQTNTQPQPIAEWLHAPDLRLTESFFEDSIRTALRHPLVAFSRREGPLPPGSLRPRGLIFHMSRCGSTLVSRTLASLPRLRVIAEPPALDQVLATGRADWLRDVASALGTGPEPDFLIKLDAWHIRRLPLFREAFPDVPWIFVYRDPVEVMASHARQRGLQMIPSPEWPGTMQEWSESVLTSYLESALEHRNSPNGLFINYNALPGAIWGAISQHFSLNLTEAEIATLMEASHFDAKNPFVTFTPDTEAKRREAESFAGSEGTRRLAELYKALLT